MREHGSLQRYGSRSPLITVYSAVSLRGILGIINRQLWKPEYDFNDKYNKVIMAPYSVWGNDRGKTEQQESVTKTENVTKQM